MELRAGLVLAVCALSAALSAGHACAQSGAAQSEELGARAIFYDSDGKLATVPSASAESKPAPGGSKAPPAAAVHKPQPVPALRASVLLVGDGGRTREVSPSHVFGSGDRIRLDFVANRAGYFYLVAVGSSGRVQVIAPRAGEPAYLAARNRYTYPGNPRAYFRFDTQVGKEELWAVLSEEPLSAITLGSGLTASIEQPMPAGASAPTQVASNAKLDVTDPVSTKDLVFEEDSEAAYASIKPSAYQTESGPRKPPIMIRLVLNHR